MISFYIPRVSTGRGTQSSSLTCRLYTYNIIILNNILLCWYIYIVGYTTGVPLLILFTRTHLNHDVYLNAAVFSHLKIAFHPKSFQGQIVTELSHEPIYLYPLGIMLNINASFFFILTQNAQGW